jgi:hypothetical protein
MNLTPEDTIVAGLATAPEPKPPAPPMLVRFGGALRSAADNFAADESLTAKVSRAASKPLTDTLDDASQPGAFSRFTSGFSAGLRRERDVDALTADERVLAREYQPLVEAVNKNRPPTDQVTNPYLLGNSNVFLGRGGARAIDGAPATRDGMERLLWQRMDELRRTDPGAAANLPKSPDELHAQVLDDQRQAIVFDDPKSPLASIGSFGGGLAGGASEPLNAAGMLAGAPASTSLLRTFAIEGGVNTFLDAVSLPSRLPRYQRLGEPMDTGDVAAELGGDFVLGGAIPVGLKLGGHALAAAFDKAHPSAPPTMRAARAVVENAADVADANPHADTPVGEDLSRQALDQTERAAIHPGEVAPADTTGNLGRALDMKLEAAQRRGGFTVQSFDPSKIITDAEAMQYKTGANAQGVTDRLLGVEKWDPAKAGLSLVWERADGQHVIADGHQRLGLAQRLQSEGHDTPFFGVPYREADGYTAPMMRVIAAAKNIAEGSGSALDAARVLRDAPELAKELPPRSALVRQARDIANLSDDAFGMAWNGVASERDAAIVGKHVRDPQMQTAILGHLAKDSPDTAEEAEIFVRQALAAGASKEVQSDMFGTYLSADLVLPERVKILKSALTSLRKDKALFATLTGKESQIAAAGNVLDTAANAANQETAARAFVTLKALAERKGPISDALQAAAERAAKGRTQAARNAATRDFLDAVRSAAQRGDLGRDDAGGALGDLGSEATRVAIPQEPDGAENLSLFGDPAGKPEPFAKQSQDLARELAPEQSKSEPPKADAPQTENLFGPAQGEIEHMRAIEEAAGKGATVADPHAPEDAPREITIKDARSEMERQARAVERLRGCVED